MCKFLIGREDLGSRVIGYSIYESNSKEFIGMTEKAVITVLKNNEIINGFKLVEDSLVLDDDGFFQSNYLIKTGINNYTALKENDCAVNNMYSVVKVIKDSGKCSYELVSSRHGRSTVNEEKLKVYLEMGVIQGGAVLVKGKLNIAKNVEIETIQEDINKATA